MDSSARAKAVADEMLAGAQMADEVARARAAEASDRGYWSRLAPEMAIGGPLVPRPQTITDASLDAVSRRFAADGYFEIASLIDGDSLARINRAIDAVTGRGWHPVFAWVYDELWSLARLPELRRVLTRHLGDGYAQIPHIWTHVVTPAVGAAGWPPHFDFKFDAGGRASVWMALTDATLTNGCMHVVPRKMIAPEFASQRVETGRVALSAAMRALHGVRALPVPPGSALGWGTDVLHWGGPCLKADSARRAISMEFIGPGVAPAAEEASLLLLEGALPAWEDRVRMIATAILAYEQFEPGLIRFRAMAQRLRASASG